jgi:hypothetical protein
MLRQLEADKKVTKTKDKKSTLFSVVEGWCPHPKGQN